MLNVCWEEDTLFMIFEEDFRFEPEGEDVEPVFVSASTFQEVVDRRVAGAAATPVTSELRVVSLLSSNRLFWGTFEMGCGCDRSVQRCCAMPVVDPPPMPGGWHV